MICDGAKESCALKLSTASTTAAESSFMAMEGMKVTSDNGIIKDDAMKTINGVGILSKAMVPVDSEIVKIMQEK